MKPTDARRATMLAVGLLAMAIVNSPSLVEQVLSLDWYVGNLRPVVYTLQGILVLLAIGCYLARRRVDAALLCAFPTRRHVIMAIGTLALAVSLVLGVLEVTLRLLEKPYKKAPPPAQGGFTHFDRELGWSYIPYYSGRHTFGKNPREVPLYFDGIGARVATPQYRADHRVPTLMLVGGSFTMGHGVTYEESLAGQLEVIPGFPLQVVNLGVQAFGTDQSFLMLKRHLVQFPVRAVVYTFICPHVRRNTKDGRRSRGTKPRFALQSDGTLYLAQRPLLNEDWAPSPLLAYLRLFLQEYGPIPNLKLTRALVAEMRNLVERNGATFLVLYWDLSYSGGKQAQLAQRTCGHTPFKGMQLNMINTADHQPAGWDEWRVAGDGHPDERAYRHLAPILATELRGLGALPLTLSK